jgi:hypothetical protein
MDGEFKVYIGDQKFDLGYPLAIITLIPPIPPVNARISERFLFLINCQNTSVKARACRHIYQVPDTIIADDMIYEEQLISCSVWLDELLSTHIINQTLPSIYPNWGKFTEVDSAYLLSLILSKKIDQAFLDNILDQSQCFKLKDFIFSFLHDRRYGIKTEEIDCN